MEINEIFIEGLTINQAEIERKIATELDIGLLQVRSTVDLLKDGSTIPFISRYRKEATGNLDEVQVRDINHKLLFHENIETRRIEIIKSIFGQGKLTEELYQNIAKATTYTELEDLYLPFKKKKKTRGMMAIEKGLEELANLMEMVKDIEKEALNFIDAEKGINNIKEALDGAMDIIAERVAHSIDNRRKVKDFVIQNGNFIVKGLKDLEKSIYKMYYDYKEPLKNVKSHRVLAINRGEKEEELIATIDYDEEHINRYILNSYNTNNNYHEKAILDGLKRLLLPAVVREIRGDLTQDADKHGITVFADNLTNLLLTPPIKKTRILGVDPGIRTGTKAACLDENGKFLGYFMFFQDRKEESKRIIAEHINKYKLELIAVGNGTGSQDVQAVVSEAITQYNLPVQYTVVSEDGASVYSASDIAREEFQNLTLL